MYLGDKSTTTASLYVFGIILACLVIIYIVYLSRHKIIRLDSKLAATSFEGHKYIKIFRFICVGLITTFLIYMSMKVSGSWADELVFTVFALPVIAFLYIITLIPWEKFMKTKRDLAIAILVVIFVVTQTLTFLF